MPHIVHIRRVIPPLSLGQLRPGGLKPTCLPLQTEELAGVLRAMTVTKLLDSFAILSGAPRGRTALPKQQEPRCKGKLHNMHCPIELSWKTSQGKYYHHYHTQGKKNKAQRTK